MEAKINRMIVKVFKAAGALCRVRDDIPLSVSPSQISKLP